MITYMSSSPTVFVLDDITGHPQSTVVLAWGSFISLCAGLFIDSQALTQMCAVIAPPAWVHMLH